MLRWVHQVNGSTGIEEEFNNLFSPEWLRETAKETGHDRKTVRKYLRVETPPQVAEQKKRSSKLEDYREHIVKRLNEYPALTVVKIYREIRDMGYTGKYTILKDFVREIRPKSGVQAVYRFETKPGVQAQVDWGECGSVEIDGEIRKLYCCRLSESPHGKKPICDRAIQPNAEPFDRGSII